jgi:transglycosylase-like protein with SLT domain
MEHLLRVAMLLVAGLAAVATTTVFAVQHLSSPGHAHAPRSAVHPVAIDVALLSGPVPLELHGRAERWQNDRAVAADQASAAAQAAAATPKPTPRPSVRPAAAQPPVAQPPVVQPAAPPVSYPAGSVKDIITKAFTPYGAAAVSWGLRVAGCESGYNPRAYNAAGPYYGLFQFLMSTFRATPYGGQDIYDPVVNASAAAWKYHAGGAGAWSCS